MAAKVDEMNAADNQIIECAETLLSLSRAVTPHFPSHDVFPARNPAPLSIDPPLQSPTELSVPGGAKLKRPLRSKISPSPKRRRSSPNPAISPPQNFKPNCVLKHQGVSRLQIYQDLVSSIHLDHCYYSSSTAGGDNGGEQQHSPSITMATDENLQQNPPNNGASAAVSLLSTSRPVDKLGNSSNYPQPDLFKSDDVNYENFNLLLKCLTNVEEPYAEQKSLGSSTSKVKLGNGTKINGKKDGNANEQLSVAEEGSSQSFSSQLFNCRDCSKSFSKKRYLIKHTQRMHPTSTPGGSGTDQQSSVHCDQCDRNIPHAEVTAHKCFAAKPTQRPSRSELANCEHCTLKGVRKHVLEKHLVQEHGAEPVLSDDDDDGSSTISGSEHNDLQQRLMTSPTYAPRFRGSENACPICQVTIRGFGALRGHVYEHITSLQQSLIKNCPVCHSVSFSEASVLLEHVMSVHCSLLPSPPLFKYTRTQLLTRSNSKDSPSSSDTRSTSQNTACKHSMLQRFLRDSRSGGEGGIMDGGEQCAACVGSLVTSMASSSTTNNHTTAGLCAVSTGPTLLERTTTELIEAAAQFL